MGALVRAVSGSMEVDGAAAEQVAVDEATEGLVSQLVREVSGSIERDADIATEHATDVSNKAAAQVGGAMPAERRGVRTSTRHQTDKHDHARELAQKRQHMPAWQETAEVMDPSGFMARWRGYDFSSWPPIEVLSELTKNKNYDHAMVCGTWMTVTSWRSKVAEQDLTDGWTWLDVVVRLQISPYDPMVGQMLHVCRRSLITVPQLQEAAPQPAWEFCLKNEAARLLDQSKIPKMATLLKSIKKLNPVKQ